MNHIIVGADGRFYSMNDTRVLEIQMDPLSYKPAAASENAEIEASATLYYIPGRGSRVSNEFRASSTLVHVERDVEASATLWRSPAMTRSV